MTLYDGSIQARCSVTYLVWKLDKDQTVVKFVTGRTLLAPQVKVSVPKMEVGAALMASRVCLMIGQGLAQEQIILQETLNIGDSSIVLGLLAKQSPILKEYFAVRCGEIHRNTNIYSQTQPGPLHWRHIGGKYNTADKATRKRFPTTDDWTEWLNGPSFLHSPRESWPLSNSSDFETQSFLITTETETNNEVITSDSTTTESETNNETTASTPVARHIFKVEKISEDVKQKLWSIAEKRSSYQKVLRITAFFLRLCTKQKEPDKVLKPHELEKAEHLWINLMQEALIVKFNKQKLISLRPVVQNDVIVCQGRFDEKNLLQLYGYPRLILLGKNKMSKLLLEKFHQTSGHTAVDTMMDLARNAGYWIIEGAKLAKQIWSSCYECRRRYKKLLEQQMCKVVPQRFVQHAWSTVNLDLFGPVVISDSVKRRVKSKAWGLVLIDATLSGCVHLELLDSYSCDSLLRGLRRFQAYRGIPQKYVSDPGSQLTAVGRMQNVAKLGLLEEKIIQEFFGNQKTQFEFIPAASQHYNGLSENAVRKLKRILVHVLENESLTYSEIATFFCECMSTINSRPIGRIKSHHPLGCILTPNHLLLGRNSPETSSIKDFIPDTSKSRRYYHILNLTKGFWNQLMKSAYQSLLPSPKWHKKQENLSINSIVFILYDSRVCKTWKLGRVLAVHEGPDGQVRHCDVEYVNPSGKLAVVNRAIQTLSLLWRPGEGYD